MTLVGANNSIGEAKKQFSPDALDRAKKQFSPDALAHAIMARAEAAGQSVTEWLADEEHAAECISRNAADCECQNSTVGVAPQLFSPEGKK